MEASSIQRARRAAKRRGWRVEKSRDSDGGLQLIDERNRVLLGRYHDATPEQVIHHCGVAKMGRPATQKDGIRRRSVFSALE